MILTHPPPFQCIPSGPAGRLPFGEALRVQAVLSITGRFFSAQAVAAGFVAGLDGLLIAGKEDLVGRVGQVRAAGQVELFGVDVADVDRKSTRLNSSHPK